LNKSLVILGALGRIVLALGMLLLVPIPIAMVYGEYTLIKYFLYPSSISLLIGLVLTLAISLSFRDVGLFEAMAISALGWIIASIIGSIPYIYILKMSPVDAFFETMSGFTTTGMTLIKIIEGKPYSILFWRAFTQWIGGVGIILFFIVMFAGGGAPGLRRLYMAEAREEKLTVSTWHTVKYIWIIYFAYSALCTIALWLAGMNPYEAITHTFTVLSTGGFSTRTASIAAFNSLTIEIVLIVFMIIGGISFLAHYTLFTKGLRNFLRHYEVKAIFLIIGLSTAVVTYDLVIHGVDVFRALRESLFQVVSIMTTTGYTTIDINALPPLSKAVITILMFIGGGAGSTAGAIKVARIVIALKAVSYELNKLLLPRGSEKPLRIGFRVLQEEDALRITSFIIAYLVFYVAGVLILTFRGIDVFSAMSAVASAQGNVGPAFISLFDLDDVSKLVLALEMWVGRLEVLPVLALLNFKAWRSVLGGTS